jgi:hypothetical protein
MARALIHEIPLCLMVGRSRGCSDVLPIRLGHWVQIFWTQNAIRPKLRRRPDFLNLGLKLMKYRAHKYSRIILASAKVIVTNIDATTMPMATIGAKQTNIKLSIKTKIAKVNARVSFITSDNRRNV